MTLYHIERKNGTTFLYACDNTRVIEVDETKISADELLRYFIDNDIRSAHILCVYEDLIGNIK